MALPLKPLFHLTLNLHSIFKRVLAILGYTGIGVSVMMTSCHDANSIIALQKWGIMSYYHSEASKQHRKILPCVPGVHTSPL